ncbi:hypothetical protein GUJ93_ZPchr0007g4357 [Zizania palustris]|uniref:Uncharacterized protein n=1 Tax=Zizania palustris TaxID=103762 RepID=A0A8J5W5T4_ZIZPA|nr:hypothetical protein GUJ93_ZPchr0007g4357 [Zizania palustris]
MFLEPYQFICMFCFPRTMKQRKLSSMLFNFFQVLFSFMVKHSSLRLRTRQTFIKQHQSTYPMVNARRTDFGLSHNHYPYNSPHYSIISWTSA